MMGREITIEQLRQDVGLMIEKITHVTLMFRQIKLTMEEYVCLKVITMLNQGNSEISKRIPSHSKKSPLLFFQRNLPVVRVIMNWKQYMRDT